MIKYFKFDFPKLTERFLDEKLKKYGFKFEMVGFGEIKFLEKITEDQWTAISNDLRYYGVELIENQKSVLVQKIKDTITDMIFREEPLQVKSSVYLADTLGHSYGYLSNLFSEVTYTSIENFIILQKIEYAKNLIINRNLNLTEIAYKLNYSSVAHLSTQFKNTTGITPSAFQRIIEKRRDLQLKK